MNLCSVFPFFFVNNDEYLNCVAQVNKICITYDDLNDMSEDVRLNDSIPILDSDFDQQYVNDCKYYLEDEFKESIDPNLVQFSAIHFNSRSMAKNFNQISAYLSSLSLNVRAIGITETWLNSENENCYMLDGYNFINNNRKVGRGGGVGIFLDEKLCYRLRDDLNPTCSSCETVFVEINIPRLKSIVIGVIYRPPKSNLYQYMTYFDKLLQELSKEN